MSLQSTTIYDRRVYAQDSEPDDRRDGVMWVDTGSPERDLYIFSGESNTFELAAPSNIAIQDTAPSGASLGDGWIDTSLSPPKLKTYDGAAFTAGTTQEAAKQGGYGYEYSHTDTRQNDTITRTTTFNEGVWIDGIRFWFQNGGIDQIDEIVVKDQQGGSETVYGPSANFDSTTPEEITFAVRPVASVDFTIQYVNYAEETWFAEFHEVHLPAHSHNK